MDGNTSNRESYQEINLFSNRTQPPEKRENNFMDQDIDPISLLEEKGAGRRASGPKKENFARKGNMRDSGIFKPSEEAEIETEEEIKKGERLIDSKHFQMSINFITIYVLFSDDFRRAVLPKSVDIGFNVVTIICICIFLVEIIFSVKFKEKYLWTFFFWLDLISTITLIFDLTWIQEGAFLNE